METFGKLQEQKLDLIVDTFEGLVKILRTKLVAPGQPPLSIISPASSAEQREQYRQEGKIKYPNGVILITGMSKVSQGQNNAYNDALRRVGINGKGNNHTFLNFRLIPIALTCSFKFTCQDLAEAIYFSEQWFWSEMESQFFLQNEAIKIYIKVTMSDDIPFPQMLFAENGNFFVVETSLTLVTYTGRFSIRQKPKSIGLDFRVGAGENGIIVVEEYSSINPNTGKVIP